jgi:predicted DNA-binding transcriptional regulator
MTELETEVTPHAISEFVEHEQTIYQYLLQSEGVRLSQIESDLGLTRLQALEAIRVLVKKGQVKQHDRLFVAQANSVEVKS